MKNLKYLLLILVLYIPGCLYEAPLIEEHNIPIDPAVLGLWEIGPDNELKSEPEKRELVMILKFSETEYMIQYPIGKDDMYFRGYPIKIGGVSCVQLQIIGTEDGPVGKDDKGIFQVVTLQAANDELVVKILNSNLVDDELQTSSALRKAFLQHKDNEKLFRDPGKFKRVKK